MLRRAGYLGAVGAITLSLSGCLSAPPQIVSLIPGNSVGNVAADAAVRIGFDHPMDRASVAQRLRIDPQIPACELRAAFAAPPGAPCHVSWSADGTSLTFEHPGALFAPGTQYRLVLDAGVSDRDGSVNSLDHHWGFSTASAPSVRNLSTADGAIDVPVDAPIVVSFSTAMDPATTAAAITLQPAVSGTRVLVNQRDHSRFVVLPGTLLRPVAQYTLSVARLATDEHGQPLDSEVTAHFTTRGLGGGAGHVLVLLRRDDEPPAAADLTGLGPAQPGDPVAGARVLAASRCTHERCGQVARNAPLIAYLSAALSPDGLAVAVVERDVTATEPRPTSLHVVELASGADITLAAGAGWPAWAPDGGRLAYAALDGIHVRSVASGADDLLPPGDPLSASPVWSGDGSMLALPVRAADGHQHVDLADASLLVRYQAPALSGEVANPVLNQDATTLAVRRDGDPGVAGTWLIHLRTGAASPQRLGADLTPLGFADPGTLLAVERPPDGNSGLVRVALSDGNRSRLPAGPAASDLDTVAAALTGRELAYLHTDAQNVVQAVLVNADGSNPTTLTLLTPSDHVAAVAVSFGG